MFEILFIIFIAYIWMTTEYPKKNKKDNYPPYNAPSKPVKKFKITASNHVYKPPLIYGQTESEFKLKKDIYLQSPEWNKLRKIVYKINQYSCQICGSDYKINTHHITYKNLGSEPLKDLLCLCQYCHTKGHEKLGYSYTDIFDLEAMSN